MKATGWLILLLVVAAAAGFGGFWYGRHHDSAHDEEAAATEPAEEEKPVAEVRVAPLRKGTIVQTITAYGSIVAQSGDVRVVSVPFESRVARVLVTPGQQLAAGADLVNVEPSPETLVALQEAKNTLAAAERDLKLVEQRFADHLATNAELSAAQQAVVSAKLKLDALAQRNAGSPQTLKAESAGVVSKVDVQEGQIVPAGGALVEVASGNRIEAALGVEPDVAATLKVGQHVKLTPVGASEGHDIDAAVRRIGRRVDPATRLATVLATLPPDTGAMLETYLTGQFTREVPDAFVVPRDAVLAQEDGEFVLYTVTDDHAHKHVVKVGLENDHETQVIADDLKEGDVVVVSGNYTLEDGMEVKEATTEAAEPTTAPHAPTTTEAAR
jgi:RND family efflux transporter MFP subunit